MLTTCRSGLHRYDSDRPQCPACKILWNHRNPKRVKIYKVKTYAKHKYEVLATIREYDERHKAERKRYDRERYLAWKKANPEGQWRRSIGPRPDANISPSSKYQNAQRAVVGRKAKHQNFRGALSMSAARNVRHNPLAVRTLF